MVENTGNDKAKRAYPENRAERIHPLVRENQLDFLFELHAQGIPIGDDNIKKLTEQGYFTPDFTKVEKEKIITDTISENFLKLKDAQNHAADARIDIVEVDNIPEQSFDILTSDELEERRSEYGHLFEGRTKAIIKKDWMPESTTEHEQAFVDWINSINLRGFRNKIQYRKFTLYCQQAYTWLSDGLTSHDFDDPDLREEYRTEELRRCDDNNLYFLNKYIFYKEGDAEDKSGRIKYVARPAHEVMAYLDDCGYSVIMTKGRQIAATTTLMAIDVRDVVFKQNHFMKFITEDDEKAVEIFEDKLKFAFSELEYWMRPNVLNERDNLFRIGYKKEKGKKEGVGSKIMVVVPKRTAIAGGAPQKVKIDEAGNIPILGVMIGNARPTMYWTNPKTKKLEVKRRLWAWGCVCAGTKVWTHDGRYINIEDLKQEDGIIGYNGKGLNKEPITWMKPPEEKECYRITTTGGNVIECSHDHPLFWSKLSYSKMINSKKYKKITIKKAEDVSVGDHLMCIESVPIFGTKKMWSPRLIGLLIGDGSYGLNSRIEIGGQDSEIHDYLIKNFNTHEIINKKYTTKSKKEHRAFNLTGYRNELREIGIFGQTKNKKRLPENIHLYDKNSIAEMIGGYYDADGHIKFSKEKGIVICLTSAHKEILEEVKTQLIKFGINSYINKENRKSQSLGSNNVIYRLYTSDKKSVLNFRKNISLLCNHKQNKLDLINEKGRFCSGNKDAFFEDPKTGKGAFFIDKFGLTGMCHEKVIKVEKIGNKPIYNLTAGHTHTYLANNFITHNTGGELDKGGGAFQSEFMAIYDAWLKGQYDACIVPIFFDWTCRYGATQEDYDREKRMAYSKATNPSDPKAKQHITEFYQTWPSSLADVFRTSATTLLDEDYIEKALMRIREAKAKHNFAIHQSGFFEPIYDTTMPTDEGSDVPFKIIGAEFIPTEDIDARASTIIFQHPRHEWRNRYFKGTDPIDTDSGLSDFASTVWDKYFKTPSAVLAWRTSDYPQAFLQSLLLNLYYGSEQPKKAIPELIESNRGSAYYQYIKTKGFENIAVCNYELPDYLQNKSTKNEGVGIDSHGDRTIQLVHIQFNMFKAYGTNFWIEKLFEQAKTFTCKISSTGKEMWGPMNKKHFKDDTLWSTTYSYICGELCFPTLIPTNSSTEDKKLKIEYKLKRGTDNKLKRVPVKVR